MTCYFPVGCYDCWNKLSFRPCGQCIGCRLDYSRQWAIRCVHESQLHDENCFITLTYNNENLPQNRSVDKREIQMFMKKLRKNIDKKVRYFSCGEYGEKFNRPHYHIALFGYDFDDKEMFKCDQTRWKDKNGRPTNTLYRSRSLEDIWTKGFSSIGELTFESAGYIARYVTKKITGDKGPNHYKGRMPEFALMSRRPGIGTEWIERYYRDVYPKDFITFKGKKIKPPKHYDAYMKKNHPEEFEKIKEKREKHLEDKLIREPELRGEGYRNYCRMKHKELLTKNTLRRIVHGNN